MGKETLPKKALRQITSIAKTATVMEAVRVMSEKNVGAVVVLEGEMAQGIFSERDVVRRIVLEGRDPNTTRVGDVMTSPVITIASDTDPDAALRSMVERHIRHLPVVDANKKVVAMLSMRYLMRAQIEDLENAVESLEAYAGVDGPGG